MKLTKYDKPISEREYKSGHQLAERKRDPNCFSARVKATGTTLSPSAVKQRMVRYGFETIEEAVAYVPKRSTQAGKKGKQGSYWARATPESSLEYQIVTGKVKDKRKRNANA